MNLHEYQGKSILKSYGVAIQEGIVANTADEAVEAAKKLTEDTGTSWWVIKAQIHAGGRGKGGGVKLAKSLDDVRTIADEILGMHIIGARAADLIMEGVTAMEFRASAEDISRMSHGHPTYSEAVKEAALDATEKRPLHV